MIRRPTTLAAAFAGHRFLVRTDDTFLLKQRDYLQRFAPHANPALACGQLTEVRVRHDADVFHDRMVRLAAAPSEQVVPFRGEPYLLAATGGVSWWRPDPTARLPQEHLYAKDAAGRLHILLDPEANRGERYLMRVVREVVLRCAENRGWALFHAAAAAVDRHGILIAGPSGAGKTTVLTALAAHRRADLVASDRAAVTESAASIVGVPISVRMARGTLAALAPHASLPPHEPLPASFGTARKAACTPRDFALAFATRVRESAPTSLVVIPHVRDDQGEMHTEVLGPQAARDALAAACCTPHDEDWLRPWFTDRTQPLTALATQASELIQNLVANVPVVAVSAGVHTPQLLERLADAVTGRLP